MEQGWRGFSWYHLGGFLLEGYVRIYPHLQVCVLTEPRERCQIPCSVIVHLNPLRQVLLQNPELQWQPVSPGTGGTRVNASMLTFCMEAGNLNSSPQACKYSYPLSPILRFLREFHSVIWKGAGQPSPNLLPPLAKQSKTEEITFAILKCNGNTYIKPSLLCF